MPKNYHYFVYNGSPMLVEKSQARAFFVAARAAGLEVDIGENDLECVEAFDDAEKAVEELVYRELAGRPS